jgi:signal transduction histidine kinase
LRLGPITLPTGPAWYAENFERVEESAAAARRLVSKALAAWRMEQLNDPARSVLTELVSNAVRHADGQGMRVNVQRMDGRRVRVSVLDRSLVRPVVRHPGPDGEGGRGLYIVDAMSACWGVDELPGGKRVWAEVETT